MSEVTTTASPQSSRFLQYIDSNHHSSLQYKNDSSLRSRGHNSAKDDSSLLNKESPLKNNIISVDSTKSTIKKSNIIEETPDRSSHKVYNYKILSLFILDIIKNSSR